MVDLTSITSVGQIFTPRRSTRHSNGLAQVDTEGRRSRFHSPPPPPGASPSLLLPTPGRYASDASGLISRYQGFEEEAVETSLLPPNLTDSSPLKLDSTLNNVATLHLLSDADQANQQIGKICLNQWSLRFVPIKAPLLLRDDVSDLTHWIIACGIRHKTKGTRKDSFDSQWEKSEPWRSSLIYQRQDLITFFTGSGSIYKLEGSCDFEVTSQKISFGFAQEFKNGLPEDWIDLVIKEARQKGFVRNTKLQMKDTSDRTIQIAAANGAQYKRKRKANGVKDALSKRRKPCIESSKQCESDSKKASFFMYQETSNDKTVLAKLPKGVSRELIQLQSSKLGSLPLVRAAILEGMNTPRRDLIQEDEEDLSSVSLQANTVNGSQRTGKKALQAVVTPLRSSSRARNATSEWWKVSNSSRLKSHEKEQHNLLSSVPSIGTDQSPIKSVGIVTDESDLSMPGEEYKYGSSSSGEEENKKSVKVNRVLKRRDKGAILQKKVGFKKGKEKNTLITDFLLQKKVKPEQVIQSVANPSPRAICVEGVAVDARDSEIISRGNVPEISEESNLDDKDEQKGIVSFDNVEWEDVAEDEILQVEAQLTMRPPLPVEEEEKGSELPRSNQSRAQISELPRVNQSRTQVDLVTVMSSDFPIDYDDGEGGSLFYFSD